MNTIAVKLTVYFEDPFWVGIYERIENGMLRVCRVVSGAEPKDYEVYEYFLKNWSSLRFSPPLPAEELTEHRQNPKRMQRSVQRALSRPGIGTKSQQALQLQREEGKARHQETRKRRTEEEKERRFLLRQQRKKERHKGR